MLSGPDYSVYKWGQLIGNIWQGQSLGRIPTLHCPFQKPKDRLLLGDMGLG